ncbi:hypothetical protein Misp01_09510 [Microtetraspora sp. NBRC 13810]|nr:hypothetical protein Misp01_09510 [Microtetraspora sp. NBRC 13810]
MPALCSDEAAAVPPCESRVSAACAGAAVGTASMHATMASAAPMGLSLICGHFRVGGDGRAGEKAARTAENAPRRAVVRPAHRVPPAAAGHPGNRL